MQTAAFTAREGTDAFLLVAPVEVETSAIRTASHFKLANRQDIETTRDVFPHSFVVGQIFT